LKLVKTMDREGFGQPVEAARLLIPADWKYESSVRWVNTPCIANLVEVFGRASSPDGISGFEFFTPHSWQWTDDPAARQMAIQMPAQSCEMRPPVGAAEYIRRSIVPRFRQGAQMLDTQPMPQVAQAKETNARTQYAQLFQSGVLSGFRVDAARVKLRYQIGGRPVEEWISGTTLTSAMPIMSATAAMSGQMAQTTSYTIAAEDLIATRAPAGELEGKSKLFATMVSSIRPNQQWVAAVQQVITNIGNAQIKGAADRSRIWTKASRETNEMIVRGYQERQAVQDRLATQYDQSIRGVETFVNPSTHEQVELTGGYKDAWSNGLGEYILSDSTSFNPSMAFKGNWVRLERPTR
jgi:hypothetical protein